jgi:hypothetical protein
VPVNSRLARETGKFPALKSTSALAFGGTNPADEPKLFRRPVTRESWAFPEADWDFGKWRSRAKLGPETAFASTPGPWRIPRWPSFEFQRKSHQIQSVLKSSASLGPCRQLCECGSSCSKTSSGGENARPAPSSRLVVPRCMRIRSGNRPIPLSPGQICCRSIAPGPSAVAIGSTPGLSSWRACRSRIAAMTQSIPWDEAIHGEAKGAAPDRLA